MLGKARGLLVATILGTLGLAGRTVAQPPPAAPVPVLPDAAPGPIISRPVPVVTPPVSVPPPYNPAPSTPPPYTPAPSPPYTPAPYTAPPYTPTPPPPGPPPHAYGVAAPEPLLFFNWEVQFLQPTVSNHLNETVTLPNGTTKTINLPGVHLGFLASPLLELGYRLPDSFGQFSVGYRFLVADGNDTRTVNGVETPLHSRFDLNQLDFDYGTARYEPEPQLWFQARIGARVAWTYYDTRSNLAGLSDRESSYLSAAGPHVTLDLERKFFNGFGVFGKVDGAVLIGESQERFGEQDNNSTVAFLAPQRSTVAAPTFQAQVGFSYSPPTFERLRFRLGYQYEEWFHLNGGSGNMNLSTQGGFLRGEIDF